MLEHRGTQRNSIIMIIDVQLVGLSVFKCSVHTYQYAIGS
jgi:hypothetical protein